jgi:hypothetical protein
VSLLWAKLNGGIGEPKLIEIAREIDLNLIENPKEILPHKIFLDQIFFNDSADFRFMFLQNMLYYDASTANGDSFDEAKDLIDEAQTTIESMSIQTVDYVKCGILKKPSNIDSDVLAHFMLKKDIDLALLHFDIKGEGIRVYSVRKLQSNTRISVEDFCSERGGGGRETAGAFKLKIGELLM